jgi:ABC-2 type transport system permease protein
MLTDILTILQKELTELLFQRGQGRSTSIRMLIFVGVFGILLPLQNGIEGVQSPVNLAFWAWIPYLLVSGVTADTFAGERERHTLETLLASRLSDRAILFGKLAAVVAYGWGITLAVIALSLVTVNLAYWQGTPTFYPLDLFAVILALSLLIAVFAAGLGIAISLRSATARAAQQTMSIIMFVLLIPLFALSFLPREILSRLDMFLDGLHPPQIIAATLFFLLAFDGGLLAYALKQFQRAKLISD